MARRRRPLVLPVLMTSLLAVACGSTVQVRGSLVAGDATGGQLTTGSSAGGLSGATAPAGSAPVSGVSGGAVSTGPGGVGRSTAAGSVATASGTGPVAGGSTTSVLSGPGVTDKLLYVGAINLQNADAVNKAAGAGAISHGDTLANTRAVVADINKHGGVAGRQIKLVVANFDTTSTQTLDQQWAAICQQFTQDNHVFVSLETGTPSFHDCLRKAGAVILSSNLYGYDANEYATHPGLIEQSFPNVDRLARYMVPSLVEQHYFTGWNSLTGQASATTAVKVGVLTYDDKFYNHAVDTYLVPELKQLGYTPVVERIGQVSSAGDYGSQAAAVKSAQLTFAADGVTHVISFESNGGLSTFFLPNARSQNYFPRYGVNTASGSEALIEAGLGDGSQFNGAVGFGWEPAVDLKGSDFPESSPYSNAARVHCRNVMRQAGLTPDSGNAEAIMLGACTSLYLLQTTLLGVTEVNQNTFLSHLEALGSSYLGAGSLGERFQPGQHDSASGTYDWHYDATCTCMRYYGGVHSIPA